MRQPVSRVALGGAILALAAAACSSSGATNNTGPSPSGAASSVTIAVGGPFSGSEKPTGEQILAGAKLAADQINAAGGITGGPLKGATITLKQYDDADDPTMAATQLRSVVDNADALAFVGSGLSDASIAAAPIASDAGLPYLAAYASSPKILDAAKGTKSVFVVPPTFPAYSFSVTDELIKAGHTKPAILHLQGTYGDGVADFVVQRLQQKSIKAVDNESFTFSDTDFRTQLAKIKSKRPDSLVIVGLADSDATILKQASQLGLKVPAYDPGGITNSDTFLTDAGAAANGLVGNSPSDAQRNTPAAIKLRSDYSAATGESVVPDPAAFAYEGVLAVATALAEAPTGDRAGLVAALHAVKIDDTGVGPLSFAADGSRIGGRLYIFTIKGGKPEFSGGYEQTGPEEIKPVRLDR